MHSCIAVGWLFLGSIVHLIAQSGLLDPIWTIYAHSAVVHMLIWKTISTVHAASDGKQGKHAFGQIPQTDIDRSLNDPDEYITDLDVDVDAERECMC
jgi:hypothetical protein